MSDEYGYAGLVGHATARDIFEGLTDEEIERLQKKLRRRKKRRLKLGFPIPDTKRPA